MNNKIFNCGFLAMSCVISAQASAAFVEDSHASLAMRNFYINSDFRDGVGASSKSEEWAQGFVLRIESGFTDGLFGFGVDALGMQAVKLDGGKGRHQGGSMIPDDSDGSSVSDWSRLGLTAKMRVGQTQLRYGTLIPRLPILVATDARVLPQSFEGLHIVSNDIERLTINAGWIDKAVGRASSNRTGLAVIGSSKQSDGMFFFGGDYAIDKGFVAQYYFANLKDYYNQSFFGVQGTLFSSGGQSLKSEARYFMTRSEGANSSSSGRAKGYSAGGYTKDASGKIDNDTWLLSLTYSFGHHAVTAGYQQVSDNSNFIQANQGGLGEGAIGGAMYIGTDRFVGQFNRAGERTHYASYSYNFAGVGVPGLTSTLAYFSGDNIKRSAGRAGKEWERDFLVDYVVQSGFFKDVSLAWRNISYRGNMQRKQDENRLIIGYTLSIF